MITDTDISVAKGLDFTPKTGASVVVEALARRLMTPRGSLFYAPDYGVDIREAMLSRLDERALYGWKATIEQQCMEDDRVASATADLEFNPVTDRLAVTVSIELIDGPPTTFGLVVSSQAPATSPTPGLQWAVAGTILYP